MLRTIELVLPALIPSWEFFKDVAPSPRIEYWVAEDGPFWREFQPRPMRVPIWAMIVRLIWNPRWNEQLFLVSCAERLVTDPTEHSVQEIKQRLAATLRPVIGRRMVQFRLVFVSEACGRTTRSIEYESAPFLVVAQPA
jgi:hypothetical protein